MVGLQEHVMRVHKYTPKQLRHNTRRDHHHGYIYTMPDGVDWLLAERVEKPGKRKRQKVHQ